MPTGTCILVEGVLRQLSAEGKHAAELEADKVLHIGTVELDKYPLSKKRLPLDLLRDYSQFRPRTTTDSINCANEFFKCLCKWVLENCSEDIKFVAKRIDNTCIYRLEQMVSSSSEMVSYNEAVEVLRKVENKKFETNLEFGVALTTEHLSYLVDHIYKRPVIIYNYMKEVNPFYVRLNDDGKTVEDFDIVVPKVGTIIAGSQSEERLNKISSRIKELGLPGDKYEWCLDLCRHGTVKHSGFTNIQLFL